MKFPRIQANPNAKVETMQFLGLNRMEKIQEGELSTMENLSSDKFPCLMPRKKRKEAKTWEDMQILATIAPRYLDDNTELSTFTGVAKGKEAGKKDGEEKNYFYYNGTQIPFEDKKGMNLDGTNAICLVDFNGTIVIAPQMYYFRYVPEEGKVVRKMEQGPENINISISSKGNPDKDAYVTNWAEFADNETSDWSTYFKSGDCIFLSNFKKGKKGDTEFAVEQYNTVAIDSKFESADETSPISVIVEKIEKVDKNGKTVTNDSTLSKETKSRMYFKMYNRNGKEIVFASEVQKQRLKDIYTEIENYQNVIVDSVNIKIPIPKMNWLCVHANRLWGTNPNGEQIYASKLGDPFNFNTFSGLATDSWYSEIGTQGEFVGIVSCREDIVAFKRNYVHHVYGDKPANFSIPKQMEDCGCIDIHSVREIGGTLYFLGYNGFYAYGGGQPQLISDKLACLYESAVGATDGTKYYVSAKRRGREEIEFLVYDPRYGLWHKEDELNIVGSVRWHDKLYVATENKLICLNPSQAKETEAIQWNATTGCLTENAMEQKGINEIFIRLEIMAGGNAKISVKSSTEKDFTEYKDITEEGFVTCRVPVRFRKGEYYQIKIEGKGDVIIHEMQRSVYAGGRRYV